MESLPEGLMGKKKRNQSTANRDGGPLKLEQ